MDQTSKLMCRAVFSAKARLIVGQDWTYKVMKLFVDNFFTDFANNRKQRNWSLIVWSSHTSFFKDRSDKSQFHAAGNTPSENDWLKRVARLSAIPVARKRSRSVVIPSHPGAFFFGRDSNMS